MLLFEMLLFIGLFLRYPFLFLLHFSHCPLITKDMEWATKPEGREN